MDLLNLVLPRWRLLKHGALTSESIGWIALAMMILSSSTYNSFGKQLTHALSPLTLLVLSEVLTAFFVLLAFGVLPMLKNFVHMPKRMFLPLVTLGLLNGIIAPLIFFRGLMWTTAVNAELFSRMEMVALLLFAIAILREEHLTRTHVIAGSVILLGIGFVVLRGFSEGVTLRGGDPLILLSACIFASGSVIYKKFLRALNPEVVIVGRACVAVGVFFLLSPFIEHTLIEELHAFPIALIPALLGFAFVSRFLNLFSFYEAIERIPVSAVSFLSTLNIITGVLFAYFYLHEAILWYHLIGGACIVLGALLLEILGVHPTPQELERHLRHR